MATREELISQCRYYKGEERNPYKGTPLSWFWDMERVYVKHNGVFDGEASYYKEIINGRTYPDIPFPLLMVMFTSWAKWAYYIEDEIWMFYKQVDLYLAPRDYHTEGT